MKQVLYFFLLLPALTLGSPSDEDPSTLFIRTTAFSPAPVFEEVQDFFFYALEEGATHLLVIEDTLNCSEPCHFIAISYPAQDVDELIATFTAPGYYRVVAVYATHLDFDAQYSENNACPWHPESAEELNADLPSLTSLTAS